MVHCEENYDGEYTAFAFESMDVAISYAKCLSVGREETFNDTDDAGIWRLSWRDPKGYDVSLIVHPT